MRSDRTPRWANIRLQRTAPSATGEPRHCALTRRATWSTTFVSRDRGTGLVSKSNEAAPDYANWVSTKLVYWPGILAVLLGGLSLVSPWFALPSILLFACSAYFAYARWEFSPEGGAVQSKIQALVLERLHWEGRAQVLDIGCGNGPLTIAIAKTYPTLMSRVSIHGEHRGNTRKASAKETRSSREWPRRSHFRRQAPRRYPSMMRASTS
jgi:hypothetical protein